MKEILIVEDEFDLVDTLTLLFEAVGFKVLSASNGAEALTLLNNHAPDIILSDCMMPVMDGVTFRNRVRELSAFEKTPFILMSGAPEQHDLANTVFDAFLKKPFQFDGLMLAVSSLLE